MRKQRLSVLCAALLLASCDRSDFKYVALAGDNVEIREHGKPPVGLWHVGGAAIPIRYAIKEPGVSITLAVGREAFVPSLDLASSAPIRAVSAAPLGQVIRRSQEDYEVFWSDAPVGSSVQIKIELEQRDEPIVVAGVVARSGSIYSADF